MKRTALVPALALLLVVPAAAEPRNGRRYDSGAGMTARAPGAPAELDRAAFLLGDWDVEIEIPGAGGESRRIAAEARITFMNRGHGLMETLRAADWDGAGTPRSELAFLTYNPRLERWVWGRGDSYSESIQVADGRFDGGRLVLATSVRRNGGMTVTHTRRSLAPEGGGIVVRSEESVGDGAWSPVETRRYRRRERPAAPFFAAAGFGAPAPGRPAEAAAFDFLIGEWTSTHQLTPPGGNTLRWRSNSTAVHVLDGHAVLEFDWFDADPGLPDAATSILRIYNRAARRWESLYLPNRGNTLLFFGGVREGDTIVLHPFETDLAGGVVTRFVFHDVREDGYDWYSETSRDRGLTFTKSWIIAVTPADPTPPAAAPAGAGSES